MNCLCSYHRQESIQNLWTWQQSKTNTHTHQSNTNAHSIIQKSMLIATDFLSVGFSMQRTFTIHSMPPPSPCHSARSRRRSRRIHHRKINPRLSREAGPSQTMGEGWGRALSSTPHPPWRAPSPQGEGCSPKIAAVDSATPGKPFVQNDIRVRDEFLKKDVVVQGLCAE